jgi:Mrp family chromosome partitioning ATPase
MELISLPNASRIADVSVTTHRNYIRDKRLAAYEKGGRLKVECGELAAGFGPKRLTPQGVRQGTRIIAVANQKGGVGKTTTAVALASILAREAPVLTLDCDAQANMTQAFGFEPDAQDRTLYNVLVEDITLDNAFLRVGPPPPDLTWCRPTWTWPTRGGRSPAGLDRGFGN